MADGAKALFVGFIIVRTEVVERSTLAQPREVEGGGGGGKNHAPEPSGEIDPSGGACRLFESQRGGHDAEAERRQGGENGEGSVHGVGKESSEIA